MAKNKKMSYDEAVKIVLRMKDKVGTMPTKEEYEKLSYMADVEDLADALGVRDSMKELNVRAYAAVNIEVLHELRRRNGFKVDIIDSWSYSMSKVFDDLRAPANANA